MDLTTAICDRTMRAAADLLGRLGVRPTSDEIGALETELRRAIVDGHDELVDDTREASQAHMGDAMLEAVFSAGCSAIAVRAIRACGLVTR